MPPGYLAASSPAYSLLPGGGGVRGVGSPIGGGVGGTLELELVADDDAGGVGGLACGHHMTHESCHTSCHSTVISEID